MAAYLSTDYGRALLWALACVLVAVVTITGAAIATDLAIRRERRRARIVRATRQGRV